MDPEEPETETLQSPGAEALGDELEQHKKSLAGFLGHFNSTVKNAKIICITESSHGETLRETQEAWERLNLAWERNYENYKAYVTKSLGQKEFERVMERYLEASAEYCKCSSALEVRLLQLKKQINPLEVKSKSNSVPSSKQSKLKELKRNIEMKKLMLKQEQERAQYELEMERQKIELEFKNKIKACEMKFKIETAEKEAELLERYGSEATSSHGLEDKSGILTWPQMSGKEKIDRWSAGLDAKPLNPEAADFVPERNPLSAATVFPGSTAKAKIADEKRTANESSTQDVDSTVVLLKLTMLQAMQPVKFSGNPSDYPTFRERLRDNLEDEVLSDSQKLEFLPKFVTGEVYEVIQRVAGCSYETIMEILHERYGNPAAVAAACIESLTNGPKLSNSDYTGLRNLSEQLEAAAKKLRGCYEQEASTMANLKQIVRRLPSYLINKWGDVSYSIRENGGSPRLSDLAKFVKRQAAIKNDPGFVVERRFQRSDLTAKASGVHPDRQTSNYATDMTALGVTDVLQRTPKLNLDQCPRCSGKHELAECGEFQADEIQARWNIVKQHRLCHVCLKPGHMRSHCQSRIVCQCGADRRHHKLLHNPPRRFEGLVEYSTEQEPHSSVKAVLSDTREMVGGSQQPERSRTVDQYATATKTTASSRTILLHVVPVRVIAPQGNSITTYGSLDNASRGTIISKDIANILCLEGQKELVSVNTVLE